MECRVLSVECEVWSVEHRVWSVEQTGFRLVSGSSGEGCEPFKAERGNRKGARKG